MTDIEEIIETISECTEDQWAEEMKADAIIIKKPDGSSFPFGRKLPCPCCQTVGFYGPRVSPSLEAPTRKYRACKFCGFWQEVWGDGYNSRGGAAYRCIHLTCTNEKCKTPNWTAANEGKSCDVCKNPTVVSKWASDDTEHPFHQIKEAIISSLNS